MVLGATERRRGTCPRGSARSPGGHNIPEEIVRRRFLAGRANFDDLYKGLVDAWVLYDNSGTVPVLLDWGEKR